MAAALKAVVAALNCSASPTAIFVLWACGRLKWALADAGQDAGRSKHTRPSKLACIALPALTALSLVPVLVACFRLSGLPSFLFKMADEKSTTAVAAEVNASGVGVGNCARLVCRQETSDCLGVVGVWGRTAPRRSAAGWVSEGSPRLHRYARGGRGCFPSDE